MRPDLRRLAPEGRHSPTPTELRERSRRYREAARKSADAAIKRELAAHAAALAQIAEAIERIAEVVEREGDAAQREKMEAYERMLAAALSERVRALLRDQRRDPDARGQIQAWRARDEELRATADQFVIPSAQDALRRAAANCERLADNAEALLSGRASEGDKKTG